MDITQGRMAQRPESTVARSFAADLDSMFGLSPNVDGLSQTVEEKKANIDSGTAELNELEARLKAAEERLAKVSRSSSPAPRPQLNTGAALSSSPRNEQQTAGATSKTSPLAQKPTYPADRPPTAPRPRKDREDTQMLMSGMPGHLPSTPRLQSATNDYVMVESQGSRNTAEY